MTNWRICPKCGKKHRLLGMVCAMCFTLDGLESYARIVLSVDYTRIIWGDRRTEKRWE